MSEFADNYSNMKELTKALKKAGLDETSLILGVDFTASNLGAPCRGGKSLHDPSVPDNENPYASAISIIGKALAEFDADGKVPCYGFGCSKTNDVGIMSFMEGDKPCKSFKDVLTTYEKLVPKISLCGPTSFVPLINQAINFVKKKKGDHHCLIILTDGGVSDEKPNADAIVEASNYPLSIVVLGVGDGPWGKMVEFDRALPARKFDNFQFVNFGKVMADAKSKCKNSDEREAYFALHALMEIPAQYKAIKKLGLHKSCDRDTMKAVKIIEPPK